MKLPPHECTTAQLGAAYPIAASSMLPVGGVLVGRDRFGGAFVHDPFDLYASGTLTNPNIVVLGQIGRGKSAFVKSYLFRQAAFGRRIVVLDPKGEYGPLAEALGTRPLRLSPGGTLRLNPLDVAGADDPTSVRRRRLERAVAIAVASLRRELRPVEHAALEIACRFPHGMTPVLADLVAALLAPRPDAAAAAGVPVDLLEDGGRDLALELRRLVAGELRGMFDGPTSPGVGLDGAVVVIDLGAVYHSPALGVLITCAAAAVERALRSERGAKTLLVVDEAWAVLGNLGVAHFLQSSWKLARAFGVANVAVVHRVSDLAAVGGEGSEASRLALGLLADSETVVCYGQASSKLDATALALGLSEAEVRIVGRLGRGSALWRVAGRSYLVEHRLAPSERALVDTDGRMRGDR